MKNRLSTILIYIGLAVGIIILNYPGASNLYNRLHEGRVIAGQGQSLMQHEEAELQRIRMAAEEYNARLALNRETVVVDAFSQTAETVDEEYESLLNINGDGVMGAVEIPELHIYIPIYHGTAAEVLERGAGHMQSSSLPVGGSDTHAVITGHRGLPSAELFTNLDKIKKGDLFYLHILQETYAYQVVQIKEVLPEVTADLEIQKGEDYVTLVTCTPYGINSHRLLIRGIRVPYTGAVKSENEQLIQSVWQWLLEQKVLLLTAIAVLFAITIWFIQKVKNKEGLKK